MSNRRTAPAGGALLVAYAMLDWPLRDSVREHLYSFRRYSQRPCLYLNLAVRKPPRWLDRVAIDGVIFHTTFLSKRGTPSYWETLVERARPLARLGRARVALPQDEYLPTAPLCAFIDEFAVDHVFSVAPESEWGAIYPTVDRGRTTFSRVLTGYLDPRTVALLGKADSPARARPIDVGYRAKDLPAWLGGHARLKVEVGRAFVSAAAGSELRCDISSRGGDTLLGSSWLDFLSSCRYTLGVEGGASVLDHDGSVKRCCDTLLAREPEASYARLEAECFPGRDGEFGLVALSPRHLEACATRTCQLLVAGDYNGVLEPWRHYIPIRRDLSNMDEVVAAVRSGDRRAEIVETAWRDVVVGGEHSYPRFVETVEAAIPAGPPAPSHAALRAGATDVFSWAEVIARLRAGPPLRRLLDRRAPPPPSA